MLPCRDETIFCCWLSGYSPGKQVEGLADNPWIAISASPDHDCITTGLCKHGFNPVCIEQVATTNDRDSQGFLEGSDLLPFGLAAKHLRPGSRVQGEGVNTLFNGNPGNFHEVDRVTVPTGAELDGQWLARRFADCRDDPGNLGRCTQQGASCTRTSHLADRATEIQVNQIGLFGNGLCRFRHADRVIAE